MRAALLEAAGEHPRAIDRMKLLAGNSNRTLAAAIARVLDLPLTKANIRRFQDNEVFVVIEENVRGETCSLSSRPASRPTTTSWSC